MEPFGDDTGRAVFARCGELSMPIGILAPFGTYAETLEKLAADFPSTPIIMDHFGGAMNAETTAWSAPSPTPALSLPTPGPLPGRCPQPLPTAVTRSRCSTISSLQAL